MNWVKKWKLLVIKAIKHNNCPCNELEELWQVLHQSYNVTQDKSTNPCLLEEVPLYPNIEWLPFSKTEFINAISKYSNLSTPSPDHIS